MEILAYNKIGNGIYKYYFLHELMGDSSNYKSCLNYFDENLFSYFMVDLRGYGESKYFRKNII